MFSTYWSLITDAFFKASTPKELAAHVCHLLQTRWGLHCMVLGDAELPPEEALEWKMLSIGTSDQKLWVATAAPAPALMTEPIDTLFLNLEAMFTAHEAYVRTNGTNAFLAAPVSLDILRTLRNPERISETLERLTRQWFGAIRGFVYTRRNEQTWQRLGLWGLAADDAQQIWAGVLEAQNGMPQSGRPAWSGDWLILPMALENRMETVFVIGPCQPDQAPPAVDIQLFGLILGEMVETSDLSTLLRMAKNEWMRTFDAILDGVAIVDEHGVIKRINNALAERYGKPPAALIGLRLADIDDQFPPTPRASNATEAVAESTVTTHELDGRTYETHTVPLTGGQEGARHIHVSRDVTKRKALERQLAQSERLTTLGHMARGVAHEVNNPLTYIHANLHFLHNRLSGDPECDAIFRETIDGVERIAAIVRELGQFTRIEGTQQFFSIEVAARTAVAQFQDPEANCISLKIAPDLPPVRGDGKLFAHLLTGLLNNALEAPDQKTPRRIFLQASLDKEEIVLRVEDNGPGIPDADRERIFEPFFTTKPPGSGTGLNLTLTRTTLYSMGGSIRALPRSTGACLEIRFPMKLAPDKGPD